MRLKFGVLGLNITDNLNRTINYDCPLKIIGNFEHGLIYLSFLCIFIGPSKNIFSDFFPEKNLPFFFLFDRSLYSQVSDAVYHYYTRVNMIIAPVNCLVIKTIFAEKCESYRNVRNGNLAF